MQEDGSFHGCIGNVHVDGHEVELLTAKIAGDAPGACKENWY